MANEKTEMWTFEITPLHKPQLSLWFVILISLVFAWPLGAYGKDEEGKKSESRVRCWWIRAQKPSPEFLMKRPLRDALTSHLRVKALWATRLHLCSCGLILTLPRLVLPCSLISRSCFGAWSLLQFCLCGCGCFHPHGSQGLLLSTVSRGGSTLSQPRLRKNDLKG